MYERGPDEAELKAFGLTPEDFEGDPIEIWPENEQAFFLFQRMVRRWNIGMAGPTGLDFNVLYRMMDRMNLTPDRYDELEIEITVLESAALEEMSKK